MKQSGANLETPGGCEAPTREWRGEVIVCHTEQVFLRCRGFLHAVSSVEILSISALSHATGMAWAFMRQDRGHMGQLYFLSSKLTEHIVR